MKATLTTSATRGAMSDDAQLLEARKNKLLVDIEADSKRYLWNARRNYFTAQAMSWGSLAASGAAALLGLIPSSVDKWVVGVLAALSAALIAASRQLGFQQKANWHYGKVDRLSTLRRRLSYELPILPSADNIAAISSSWSAIDTEMSKESEDMQHETAETKNEVGVARLPGCKLRTFKHAAVKKNIG